VSRLTIAAARFAVAEAGLDPAAGLGLVVGTELGDFTSTIAFADGYLARGPAGLSALLFPNTVMNTMAAATTIALSARALSLTLNAHTVAGELAVAQGASAVAADRVKVMLAGGVDQADAYRARTLHALRAPGQWWSDGATFLVLEALESAAARGARILGEIRGVAWRTLPAKPHGVGRSTASRAIAAALAAAGSRAASLGWTYTSASGDSARDEWERGLLETALAPHRPPAAALRGLLGQHAGVGALTVAAAAWTARTGALPLPGDEASAGRCLAPGPGLVHAVARGGDHVALVVGA
jgi:3-oxoacyl-[acyl-carrier-protein] synthase II